MTEFRDKVNGVVMRGHMVASRPSEHYPRGTIEMQLPYFKALGLDLSPYYLATLNISIEPITFSLIAPEYTFRQVHWTDAHPPEDFSFSPCRITYRDEKYQGWIYYPHPETKERHFQNDSIIEVIAKFIPEIRYGDEVSFEFKSEEISMQKNRIL